MVNRCRIGRKSDRIVKLVEFLTLQIYTIDTFINLPNARKERGCYYGKS